MGICSLNIKQGSVKKPTHLLHAREWGLQSVSAFYSDLHIFPRVIVPSFMSLRPKFVSEHVSIIKVSYGKPLLMHEVEGRSYYLTEADYFHL